MKTSGLNKLLAGGVQRLGRVNICKCSQMPDLIESRHQVTLVSSVAGSARRTIKHSIEQNGECPCNLSRGFYALSNFNPPAMSWPTGFALKHHFLWALI